MNKKVFTGMLAAIMAVSSSFMSFADSVNLAPGENPVSGPEEQGESILPPSAQIGNRLNAPGEQTENPGNQSSTITAGGSAQGQSSTITAGGSAQGQSGTITEGGSAQGQSSTITAGGSTQGQSGTITAGGGMSGQNGPSPSGSTVITSGVLAGPGVSGSGGGPGMSGGAVISDGTDGFAGTVSSPLVKVAEKYTYDQMSQDIQELASRYSSLMKVNTIGTTLDGRNLYEVVVGNINAEKHVLIHGGIHAREYMTPLLIMKQLEYGLAFYGTGSYEGRLLSDLFNKTAIHYVPMVNPDGITISQSGIGGIRSEELRRTIEQCYQNDLAQGRTSAAMERYLNYWKANGRGVDLNQNFPADWEEVTSSDMPSYATYKGAAPLSEPESQALANLIQSRNWTATISYHSMGNIIYWDYPGNTVSAQSQELANAVSAKTGYRLAGSSGHGGFKDWLQIKENPIPSLTIEVGSVSCPMPLTEFTDVWNKNQEVWAAVLKWAAEH